VRAEAVVLKDAQAVATQALIFSRSGSPFARLALVNGSVGLVVAPLGHLAMVLRFEVAGRHIAEIDVVTDRPRLDELEIAVLDGLADALSEEMDSD